MDSCADSTGPMKYSELLLFRQSNQAILPSSNAVATFLIALFIALVLKWLLRSMAVNACMRYLTPLNALPTAKCASTFMFLVGDPIQAAASLIDFARKHQPVFLQNNRIGAAQVIVMDLEALQEVMVSKQGYFGKPKFARNAIGDVLGRDGMLFADGEQYARIRKCVSPAMHYSAVVNASEILMSEAKKLRQRLLQASAQYPERPIQIKKEAGVATCNVILQFCAGRYWAELSSEELAEINAAYENIFGKTPLFMVHALFQSVFNFLNPDYFIAQKQEKVNVRRLVGLMLERALKKHAHDEKLAQESGAQGSSTHRLGEDTSILALMARGNKAGELKRHEMVDTVMTFLAAGQSTTQMTVSWTLFFLGKHSQWLRKVQAELDNMTCDPEGNTEAYVRELDDLPVLHRVIKETLRLYPPIAQTGRVALRDVSLGKYEIPAGTIIRMPIMAIQRSPEHWVSPDTFDPDRFLPGSPQADGANRIAWLPFLYGLRGCIGRRLSQLEIKCFVATIIRTHDIVVAAHAKPPVTSGSFNDPHGMEIFMRPRAQASV